MRPVPYIPEVNDCFQYGRRHFEDLGIHIRDYAFPSDFWDFEDNMFERLFAKEGFVRIDTDNWKPQAHDVLLIPGSVRTSFPTHIGIITETGTVGHHYTGRLSEEVAFKGVWRTPTVVLRHKDIVPPETITKAVDITELMPEHVRRRFTK